MGLAWFTICIWVTLDTLTCQIYWQKWKRFIILTMVFLSYIYYYSEAKIWPILRIRKSKLQTSTPKGSGLVCLFLLGLSSFWVWEFLMNLWGICGLEIGQVKVITKRVQYFFSKWAKAFKNYLHGKISCSKWLKDFYFESDMRLKALLPYIFVPFITMPT